MFSTGLSTCPEPLGGLDTGYTRDARSRSVVLPVDCTLVFNCAEGLAQLSLLQLGGGDMPPKAFRDRSKSQPPEIPTVLRFRERQAASGGSFLFGVDRPRAGVGCLNSAPLKGVRLVMKAANGDTAPLSIVFCCRNGEIVSFLMSSNPKNMLSRSSVGLNQSRLCSTGLGAVCSASSHPFSSLKS